MVQVSTVANQTVTNPVFVSHHGQLRIVQVSENRTGVVNFAAIPKTTLATKSRKAANRPVSSQILAFIWDLPPMHGWQNANKAGKVLSLVRQIERKQSCTICLSLLQLERQPAFSLSKFLPLHRISIASWKYWPCLFTKAVPVCEDLRTRAVLREVYTYLYTSLLISCCGFKQNSVHYLVQWCFQIEGYVEEAGKKVDGFHLSGFWDSHLDVVLGKKSSQRLWTKNPLPPGLNRQA